MPYEGSLSLEMKHYVSAAGYNFSERGCRLVVPGVSNTHLAHMTGRKRGSRALKHHAP